MLNKIEKGTFNKTKSTEIEMLGKRIWWVQVSCREGLNIEELRGDIIKEALPKINLLPDLGEKYQEARNKIEKRKQVNPYITYQEY